LLGMRRVHPTIYHGLETRPPGKASCSLGPQVCLLHEGGINIAVQKSALAESQDAGG
jgi:hypothetical protein